MSPRVLLRLGLRSLLLHKLRSSLSILGVVFGVAAVTAMSSVGEGARRESIAQIGALGIDTVTLRNRPRTEGAAVAPGLDLRAVESLGRVVPGLRAVAPVRVAPLVASAGGRELEVVVVGTAPAYRDAARLTLTEGRFLSALDVSDRKRVAVLGAGVAAALLPFGDARGTVRLGDEWFHVVGILEGRAVARGRPGPIRTLDVNRAVFVPWPALDRGADPRADGVDEIVLRVADASQVAAAADVARTVAVRTSGGAGFDVVVPREILRQQERTQRIFNVVTGAIAAISLLVGGIGIMNIMLAGVAERTREVGVRRALGATRRDVASQFLVECALLTSAGGVAGALLGLAGSLAIQRFAAWPTALSPLMLAVALLMALLTGVGFGFYPAWRAAHLEPMEALRHE
jgi:putative ABC transport system permease protein